jgi:hypothetical protein
VGQAPIGLSRLASALIRDTPLRSRQAAAVARYTASRGASRGSSIRTKYTLYRNTALATQSKAKGA